MQFTLVYGYDPNGPGPDESDIPAWIALSEDLGKAGASIYEVGFFPGADDATVTVENGETRTTAGISASSTIAGFITVDVASRDDAASWAAKVPVAGKGFVEIRHVVEWNG